MVSNNGDNALTDAPPYDSSSDDSDPARASRHKRQKGRKLIGRFSHYYIVLHIHNKYC